MATQPDLITVYRSMDAAAKDDCEMIVELLADEGFSPVLLDDDAPGVPEGAYEVRVPQAEASRAEELIRNNPLPDDGEEVDPSPNLDLETIYHSEGSNPMAEVEALGIKNVLEANGMAAVVVGDSVLPSFPFEVRVARENVLEAQHLIEEAEQSGPAAAEAAELQGEADAAAANEPPRP